ncbi:MAG: hypothetical protein OHK0023_05130 [Anaerolineae bacterium]
MTTVTSAEHQVPTVRVRVEWLRVISLVLAVIGIGVAGYLSYTKATGTEVACNAGNSGCEMASESVYGYLPVSYDGIPVAYLGLGGYLTIFLALALEKRIPFLAKHSKKVVLGLTFVGFLFSGYLVAVQKFILDSFCIWCMGSAVIMTALFAVSFVRMWRDLNAIPADEEA